jgi:hypothetical protein
MGSIPLPALHVQTYQPPDVMGQYGQLMALRNMMQNAPLERQLLQEQTQQHQVELQTQQQALQDQQNFRQAMQDPSMHGKTIGEVADMLAQRGQISQAGWVAAKKSDVEQRQAYATLDKDQLANQKAAHDATQTLYNNVMNMPDDQVQAQWPQIAQQYDSIPGNQKVPLNPQQPLTKDQLKQFAPFISMNNAYLNEELAKRKAQAETQQAEATTNYYAQNGGAPGVPAETRELNDFLQKNPGKTAQDFVRFKAQNSPSVIVQNLSGGSANGTGGGPIDWAAAAQKYGMTPQAFDQTAEKYFQTGQLPSIGRSANAIAMNRDLMNRAAELHPGASIAENTAEFKANTDSLKKLQGSLDTVTAFENTANKNIDMLKGFAQKVPDLGARFANVPVRMLSGSMIGSENMAAFKTSLAPVQAEAAKILNSANLQGQLSDSSRHELQDLVDGNLPYKSLVASLGVLQQDFKNRHDSTAQTIEDIKKRMGGGTSQPQTTTTDPFTQFGGKAH